MSGHRFVIFLAVVLAVWAGMHLYVFFRISSIPWVASHISRRGLLLVAIGLWACYPIARILDGVMNTQVAWPLEWFGACWVGVLFLSLSALLVVDLATLGGMVLEAAAVKARGWAAFVALVMSAIAFGQAVRAPAVIQHEVRIPGLPHEEDGLVIVQITDLHLGNILGRRWLEARVRQVNALQPDIIAAVGDIIDGDVRTVWPLVPALRGLKAPLGCWAVTGNHEVYAGQEESVHLLESAGFKVLRDRSAQLVPGLTLVGDDDLTARRQRGQKEFSIGGVLSSRPPGPAVLLSHSPLQADIAADHGVNLMLSGHTHNGQIWPFTYLVRLAYPLIGGRYQVAGTTVIVCRGTGTWGPLMRLWRRGEIIKITLRSS